MKIKLKGRITRIEQPQNQDVVNVHLDLGGQVQSDKAQGKDVTGDIVLRIKPLFAAQLRFGQTLMFTIDTESEGAPA